MRSRLVFGTTCRADDRGRAGRPETGRVWAAVAVGFGSNGWTKLWHE